MMLIQINLCAGFLIKFQVHQVICCRIHNSKMHIFSISACLVATKLLRMDPTAQMSIDMIEIDG